MILRNDAKVSSDFELDKKKENLDNFVFVVVRLFLLAKKRLTEGSFFVDGDMVDNSTQTPRDDDSGKPEEEVTIEEDDATGAAPDNPEQADKEGKLILAFNFRSQKCFVIYNSSIFSNDFFESNLSGTRTTCLAKPHESRSLGVLVRLVLFSCM